MFKTVMMYSSDSNKDMHYAQRIWDNEGKPDYYGPFESKKEAIEKRSELIKNETSLVEPLDAIELIELINDINDDVGINVYGMRFDPIKLFDFDYFDCQYCNYSNAGYEEYIDQSGDGEYGYAGTMAIPVSGELLLVFEYSC